MGRPASDQLLIGNAGTGGYWVPGARGYHRFKLGAWCWCAGSGEAAHLNWSRGIVPFWWPTRNSLNFYCEVRKSGINGERTIRAWERTS